MTFTPYLDRIVLFPLKGARGYAVDTARLGPQGLDGDRQWAVAAARDRSLITQLEVPGLSRIGARWQDGMLALSCDGHPAIEITEHYTSCPNSWIHRDGRRLPSIDAGDSAADWVSGLLGCDARVVQVIDEDSSRHLLMEGYPVTMIAASSLAQISSDLGEALDASCLRANLHVAGTQCFEEEHWHTIRLGDTTLQSEGARTLCRVINVHQSKGSEHKDMLRRFVKARGGLATFGINLSMVNGSGIVRVGMTLDVLTLGTHESDP